MKKHLLLVLSLSLTIAISAQQSAGTKTTDKRNIVNIIDIGTSANAYNLYDAQRSTLWVSPQLNTVTYFHNMGGALDSTGFVGNFGYDISTDGGNSFTTMTECYVTEDTINFTDAGKNPNHAIYNPPGNSDPDNAFVTFLASNSDTGGGTGNPGLCYGTADIGTPPSHTKHQIPSHNNYYLNSPTGFELTAQGKIFAVEPNVKQPTGEYQNNLVITKGVWDNSTSDFVYSQELLDAPVVEQLGKPVFTQVAFGQDGNTGYIVMLGDDGSAQQPGGFSGLYPIYWKTTDGGDTWTGPFFIQLDGPDGLEYIVYHLLTNEMIENLFGTPTPERTEINYTTAFDFDCSVDNEDNLHIAVVIGPTAPEPYGIITFKNYITVVDIFMNGGKLYCAEMGTLNTFRGYFDDIHCDNRVQITATQDRKKLFISWLDTDSEYAEENNNPNIFCRGIDISLWKKTSNSDDNNAAFNVTLFSDGMWKSYFFSAPEYCFSNDNYNIPFVYCDIDTNDLSQPVQFKYIQDFQISDNDFDLPLTGYVGIKDNPSENVYISQVYPNPCSDNAYIKIKLNKTEDVNLTVSDISGKTVLTKDFDKLNAGTTHQLKINVKNLTAGIYFCTVITGNKKTTRKFEIK